MKFKVIDSERLSIYLTHDELEQQKIDVEILKEPERLRKLLIQAGEQSGFPIVDSALEVEIIPILDGDLLVSIKKVEKKMPSFVKQVCFDNSESLITVCRMISPMFFGLSDLYLYEGKYYLILKSCELNIQIEGILLEFGKSVEHINEAVLAEHGKLICEQKCVEMFTKIFSDR